jgi:hypothetical protein
MAFIALFDLKIAFLIGLDHVNLESKITPNTLIVSIDLTSSVLILIVNAVVTFL